MYNSGRVEYVLNKDTSTWSTASSHTAPYNQYGSLSCIWTDGNDLYYTAYYYASSSYYQYQYVLNKSTSTWSTKSWNGLTSLNGQYIWTDGRDVYFSSGSTYALNKATSTWVITELPATIQGISLYGFNTWTHNDVIYYSSTNTYEIRKYFNSN